MVASAKELIEYQRRVEEAMSKDSTIFFFNDSILKAMIVQKAILKLAGGDSVSGGVVRMYCGKASLFLNSGQIKAQNVKYECDSSTLTLEEKSEWCAFQPWQSLRDTLKTFLEKNRLELIVDDSGELLQDRDFCSLLSSNKVSVWRLPESLGLAHFTTTLDSYRVENSDETKSATCAFHDPDTARIFFDSFSVLRRFSVPVSLQ